MIELQDYDIQLIEREIYLKYDLTPCDYADCDCLLSLRKAMINERVLREMYDRAHLVWNSMKDNKSFGDYMEQTAKCYLGYDYPALHPLQDEDREVLWLAICDSGWNPIYEDGVTLPTLTFPSGLDISFDSFIGMECPPPNWNEGLDPELTSYPAFPPSV